MGRISCLGNVLDRFGDAGVVPVRLGDLRLLREEKRGCATDREGVQVSKNNYFI